MSELQRIERGWCGHFIGGNRCNFRRNTLLSDGTRHLVVSTVGAYFPTCRLGEERHMESLGYGAYDEERYYETMVFVGTQQRTYIDADVHRQVTGDWNWALCYPSLLAVPDGVDNAANDMHEAVVKAVEVQFDNLYAAAEAARKDET